MNNISISFQIFRNTFFPATTEFPFYLRTKIGQATNRYQVLSAYWPLHDCSTERWNFSTLKPTHSSQAVSFQNALIDFNSSMADCFSVFDFFWSKKGVSYVEGSDQLAAVTRAEPRPGGWVGCSLHPDLVLSDPDLILYHLAHGGEEPRHNHWRK